MRKVTIAVAAALFSVGLEAYANGVELDESRAVMVGTGCSLSDGASRLLVNGSDVSLVSTGMNILLGGLSDSALAQRKNCVARVPISVADGLHVSEVASRLVYGVYKTRSSQASINASVVVMAQPAVTHSVAFPLGKFVDILRTSQRKTVSVEEPESCESQKGIMGFNLVTSAQLENEYGYVDLSTIQGDMRLEVSLKTKACH